MNAGLAARLFTVLCITCLSWGVSLTHHASAQESAAGADPEYQEQLARERFQLGRLHYDNGEFQQAAENFEEAFRLSKRDVLWYNIHLAHRDAGNDAKAAEALRNYLTRVEAVPNRAQLEARLEALDKQVKEAEGRRSADEAAKAEAQRRAEAEEAARREAQTKSPQVEEPSTMRKYLPYGLMGGGALLIAGGVVTGMMASSKKSELEDKCPKNQCPADVDADGLKGSGTTLAYSSLALYGVGVAAAAAGGVLWYLDWRKNRAGADSAVTGALACGREGCLGNVRYAF